VADSRDVQLAEAVEDVAGEDEQREIEQCGASRCRAGSTSTTTSPAANNTRNVRATP
jgi:hypothetical protein